MAKKEPNHITLGQVVRFHHRACLIRWDRKHKCWFVPNPDDRCSPVVQGELAMFGVNDVEAEVRKLPPFDGKYGSTNKSIFVWPYEGTATVVGLQLKSIGYSEPAIHAPSSYYGEGDWEPGFHASHGYYWLYELKNSLRGKSFLVPDWAVNSV